MHQLIVQQIIQLRQKYSRQLNSQLSIHGISLCEFQILDALEKAPTQTMRRIDLANDIGLTASGITRILAPMEKIKLVAKEANPRDARVSLIRLTKSGQTILEESRVSFDAVCQEVKDRLTSSQQQKLSQFLDNLL